MIQGGGPEQGALSGPLLAFALVLLLLVAVACVPPSTCGGPVGPPDAVSSALYNATNSTRAYAGLPHLQWSAQLWCLADEWSHHMAAERKMSHRDLSATLATEPYTRWSVMGENVLHGSGYLSASAMHSTFMNSPEHRAIILTPSFTDFAVGVVYANSDVWVTENFAG